MANSLLKKGWYQPKPESDIWSLGQLMSDTLGGKVPDAQLHLLTSSEYIMEMISAVCTRPGALAKQREHLLLLQGYLSSLPDYADQVILYCCMVALLHGSFCQMLMLKPALCREQMLSFQSLHS